MTLPQTCIRNAGAANAIAGVGTIAAGAHDVVRRLLTMYATRGDGAYAIGESVTQSEHAAQSAHAALTLIGERVRCDDDGGGAGAPHHHQRHRWIAVAPMWASNASERAAVGVVCRRFVAAALLHDVGHLLRADDVVACEYGGGGDDGASGALIRSTHACRRGDDADDAWRAMPDGLGVHRHEALGAAWLYRHVGMPTPINRLVHGHVQAKRYMAWRYNRARAVTTLRVHDNDGGGVGSSSPPHALSSASVRTLALQGGAMNDVEASTFECADPLFVAKLALRRCDDAGKRACDVFIESAVAAGAASSCSSPSSSSSNPAASATTSSQVELIDDFVAAADAVATNNTTAVAATAVAAKRRAATTPLPWLSTDDVVTRLLDGVAGGDDDGAAAGGVIPTPPTATPTTTPGIDCYERLLVRVITERFVRVHDSLLEATIAAAVRRRACR